MINIELTAEEKYHLERMSKAGRRQIPFGAGISAPASATMLEPLLSWITNTEKTAWMS